MALKIYLEGLGFRQSQAPEALKATNWTNFECEQCLNFSLSISERNGLSVAMD
jgi:hypothetical protein